MLGPARRIIISAVILLCSALGRADDRPKRNVVDVSEGIIVDAAAAAMKELRGLSDSGVYESLSLRQILSASTQVVANYIVFSIPYLSPQLDQQVGTFHHNTFLSLEIASPFFKDNKSSAIFEVIVMDAFHDNSRSFAIDNFPEMDEDAVEQFWIRKVERERFLRDEAFRTLLGEFPSDGR